VKKIFKREYMLIAHVRKNNDGTWAEPQALENHLANTAKTAEEFAAQFSSADWAKAAAMLHDLGKSTAAWQEYLCKKSGYGKEDDAEESAGRLDHSIIGAQYSEEFFGKGVGRILAYCIAGHHAGLPDCHSDETGGQSALLFRLKNAKTDEVDQDLKNRLSIVPLSKPPWKFETNKSLDLSLWIRMLFSCLVDADFLDTETYMDCDKADNRGGFLAISDILARFNTYMSAKVKGAERTKVNEIRNSVLADCRKAATMVPGIFSLNVPTGGGKTLSSLAFALEHAVEYGMDRIIYVIPYTSIIEQNAEVFRDAVGNDQVVEHHSNIDENDSSLQSCLAAENWDAPVIVTTSVQFFESLFAAKTSRCRKLHNIVNSVIVLDEAQLVPIEYLQPILETMRLLTQHYNVSFVISTATQPAFESKEYLKGFPAGSMREIITNVPKLYKDLQRVKVEPINWGEHKSFEELAHELANEERVLCVVSDRKSCRDLYRIMPEGTFHLSALMCGQHRSDTIKEIINPAIIDAQVKLT
jgi:CRISPR-associated endonuclease/helicase Cas3